MASAHRPIDKFGKAILPYIYIWLLLLFHSLTKWVFRPFLSFTSVILLPVFSVMGFGAYFVHLLIYDVRKLRDRPTEAEKLFKEVEDAKIGLKAFGVDIDP
ncbi:hypothetical protein T02_11611 [Trichinella nativa]|uniref:Dolichol-phosphate mannosyltransferase subunit 3 n=1 Tax=Trichinella nativa TaxID=6335 RepID=A0A0V1L4X7_9BILA|nr:hypothetical protein T06_16232 [Trichinella sp. T6]KRZ54591.1 hypothetical protein T02_11611 [Trichinella nativa]KRZ54592.1 hypothetical protein T02_11611 [Trichinella nativa]